MMALDSFKFFFLLLLFLWVCPTLSKPTSPPSPKPSKLLPSLPIPPQLLPSPTKTFQLLHVSSQTMLASPKFPTKILGCGLSPKESPFLFLFSLLSFFFSSLFSFFPFHESINVNRRPPFNPFFFICTPSFSLFLPLPPFLLG